MRSIFPIQKVQLQQLERLQTVPMHTLLEQLTQNGFAIVKTDGYQQRDAIVQTLEEARNMTTFRFPPVENIGTYSPEQRESFAALFRWTRICLKALLTVLDKNKTCKELWKALARCDDISLFHPNGQGNDPFQPGMDFSGSFFNVFHYDYGLLNAHRDRCLITAIAVNQINEPVAKTALWANRSENCWVNVDELVEPQDIIIFVGEDFTELSSTLGNMVPAVLHCTRVDPEAERLIYFDDSPDPQSTTKNNRVSVAFVLSDAMM